ncbi:hypothetical protein PFISCL1PPCAC_13287, partial [Pristionchus fissidentatus]
IILAMHPIVLFAIVFPISTVVLTFLTVIFMIGIDIILTNRNQIHVFVRSVVGAKWIMGTATFIMNKVMEILKTCEEASTGLSHCSLLQHILGAVMIFCTVFTISFSFVTYLGLIEPTAGRYRHQINAI